MRRNRYLFLTAILSTLLIAESSMAYDASSKKKRMFSVEHVSVLCSMIKSFDKRDITGQMDILIKEGGITKEQWNTKYAFEVNCMGSYPIVFTLENELEDFIALADYGVSLNHPFKDDDRNVTTLKDYVLHKFKTLPVNKRSKWKKIYKILHRKGAKDCSEQPELKCTATYL